MFVANRANLNDGTTMASAMFSFITSLANSRFINTIANSLSNISAHYDISNNMFRSFLSQDMTYSCAIFDHPGESLEAAQYHKLDRIIHNARLVASDHVLEIGSGWGSFAIRAASKIGCRVTTLTLSIEQKKLAEERIRAAGLSHKIIVLLCDYRLHTLPNGHYYDKIVSIEMIEAVGREFLTGYFERVHELLVPKDGIAVFQVITMPETRYKRYCSEVDFIRKYIFPGGHCPTVSSLVGAINEGSKGNLLVDSIENIGAHYVDTLSAWKAAFGRHWPEIQASLMAEQQINQEDSLIFKRKWEYYYSYCEAGFATKTLGDVIVTTARECTTALLK